MKIENIPISSIKPDKEQPRKYFDDEALERLKQSIIDNGIESPLRVKENGKGYVIIDGERRWRASQDILTELPCIIDDGKDILEKQLRTDCLKEGLTVDELDKAIYKYYDRLRTSSEPPKYANKNKNPYTQMVADSIGKSDARVCKAIDRYEFKKKDIGYTNRIESKYNPKGKSYSKVNSTIAMTKPIKDRAKREKAIESILEKRKKKTIETPEIKQMINRIANDDIDIEDVEQITQESKPDVNLKFEEWLNNFYNIKSDFEMLHFENAIEHIDKNNIAKLKRCFENIMINLTSKKYKFYIADGDNYEKITE